MCFEKSFRALLKPTNSRYLTACLSADKAADKHFYDKMLIYTREKDSIHVLSIALYFAFERAGSWMHCLKYLPTTESLSARESLSDDRQGYIYCRRAFMVQGIFDGCPVASARCSHKPLRLC